MSAPTANAWVHSVDSGRLRPVIETTTAPDGSSAECKDCGESVAHADRDELQLWIDAHDACPAVVGLVQVAATVLRNEAILGHASTRDCRDWSEWSELSPAEQAAWFTWACGGPHPAEVSVVAHIDRVDLGEAEAGLHVFDRSGTVHAMTGRGSLCGRTATFVAGRTKAAVDCRPCRMAVGAAHIEALGIKKRAFAAYSRTPLAIRHWSRLTWGEQAAWLTWVAGGKTGPAPVLDTAADLAELQRVDQFIDANPGDVDVADVLDALDPPPVVQVPPVPDEVVEAAAAVLSDRDQQGRRHPSNRVPFADRPEYERVEFTEDARATLDAIVLPLHQAWVRQAVIAELDQLLDGEHNYTPGGWFRPDALHARRAELAALIEQAGTVTS